MGKYSNDPWLSDKMFCRWRVTIPQGALIITANCVFVNDQAYWAPVPEVDFSCDDQANSPAITSEADFDSRTRTTAHVKLTPPASLSNWTTGDLKTIIQELVDSYDYSAGNSYMQLMVLSPTTGGSRFGSYDASGNASGPTLHIEYALPKPVFEGQYRRRRA